MALRGTLRDFGLADIFQLIGIQRKTGVLALSNEAGRVVVSFLSGAVVSADCTKPALEDRLGAVLVKSGKITERQLNEALKTQKTTLQRLGRVLIDQKAISAEELREALQIQVTQIIYNLFRWRDGEYDFSQEETIDYERDFFHPIPAETILMEGARMIDEWPIIERKIPDFKMILRRKSNGAMNETDPVSVFETDIDFGLTGSVEADDEKARVTAEEALVLRMVDGRSSVQDIIDRTQLGDFETCRILYEMMNRGMILPGEGMVRAPDAARAPAQSSLFARAALVLMPALAAVSLYYSPRSPLFPLGGSAAGDPFGVERIRCHLSQARVGRIDRALHLFYLDRQALPTSLEGLVSEGFLSARDLIDPWGRPYEFRIDPTGYSITGYDSVGAPDDTISAESRFLAPERLTIEGGAEAPPAGAKPGPPASGRPRNRRPLDRPSRES